MTEIAFHAGLAWVFLVLAVLAFVFLAFRAAPYGRHSGRGWGPTVPARLGWVAMELPAVVVMAVCFYAGDGSGGLAAIAFLAIWELHYVHRALVFPVLMPGNAKRLPVVIIALGIAFNVMNGYVTGRFLFEFGPDRTAAWLLDPRFLAGAALFLAGMAINVWSDSVLRRLRRNGGGYGIPRGGLFEYVSCPNYLGEILEWFGWAMATWSLPGLAFAVWTLANLGPRAVSHHRWYREKMPGYPAGRKALVPFIL